MLRKWVKDPRFVWSLTIVVPAVITAWYFGGAPAPAAVFFAAGAAYGVLLFRVVSVSVRASMVMSWAFTLIVIMALRLEGVLSIPVMGPIFMGFIAGANVGGRRWTGKRAGSEIRRKRTAAADGTFTGGWQLALINAACAGILIAASTAMLLAGVTGRSLAVALTAGSLTGWALFRFVKSARVRFMSLAAVFLALLPSLAVAGYFGYGDAVFIGLFGFLAGILIGGRYWWGQQLGAPRPPFAGNAKGPKRKRKAKKSMPRSPGGGGMI